MINIWRNANALERQGLMLIFLVFAAAYGLILIGGTFFFDTISWQPWQITVLIITAWLYLEINFRLASSCEHYTQRQILGLIIAGLLVVFTTQIVGSLIVFSWILALPLASEIEGQFPDGRLNRGLMAAALAVMVIPTGLDTDTWQLHIDAMIPNVLMMGAGLAFVVFFTRLRNREQVLREQTERLATDLESANHQLAAYATQVEELATTRERNRLAREIHDNLGHYLTVVNVQLEASKVLITKDSDKALSAINKAQRLTQEGLQAVRQAISALREGALADKTLDEAIAELVEITKVQGISAEYNIIGTPRQLDPKVTLTLYRVAQEGLTNVRKHSQAENVQVMLDYTQTDRVALQLRDDGVGSAETNSGFGLLGIRERIQLLGGQLNIATQPGEGFRIAVAIPN